MCPAVDKVTFRFEGVHGELTLAVTNSQSRTPLDVGRVQIALRGVVRKQGELTGLFSRRGQGQARGRHFRRSGTR